MPFDLCRWGEGNSKPKVVQERVQIRDNLKWSGSQTMSWNYWEMRCAYLGAH